MAIIFKLTTAGRQALVNAKQDGTAARTLVSVGITAAAFTPTDSLAAIPGEIKRIDTLAGDVVAKDTIHVTVRDDGDQTYTVRGLGLYLDNGVLLGSYSQADVILEKSAASIFLLSTDLRVLDGSVDISTLQFGETNFINPPATVERQGVVQLATKVVAEALTDAKLALTAASVAGLFAARALVGHIHDVATQAADGFMSKADKAKLDGIEVNANKYELPSATPTVVGGVKLGHATVQTVAAAVPTATASRTYPVQANSNGQMVVNVPWVDTNTIYVLPEATDSAFGGVKLGSVTVQATAANAVSATASRTYAVQANASGQMVVNVPWVNTDTTYTLPAASATVLGGVKLGHATVQTVAAAAPSATDSRTYAVQVNGSGQAVVNVPWVDTNTTYSVVTTTVNGLMAAADKVKLNGIDENANNYSLPAATAAALGGVKLGHATVQAVAAAAPSATAGRTYAVQVNANGQVVVNVPWVDTNTTYGVVTPTVNGLMAAADKQVLDGLVTDVSELARRQRSLGDGQTWQDMTASRVSGTTYTNTTGRTIAVVVSQSQSVGQVYGYVGGVVVSQLTEGDNSNQVVHLLVPNGFTYSVTAGLMQKWMELR